MEELFNILKKIADTPGRNDKENLIKEHEDLIIDTLKYLLNPFIVSNISKKKIDKKVKNAPNDFYKIKDYNEFLNYLTDECTGKDIDILRIQDFISRSEFQDELKAIATKSLKLGVTNVTINKIFGEGTIPQFDIQKASTYEESRVHGKDFIITKKVDGMKCICIIDKGKIKFYSRTGRPIEGLVDIELALYGLGIDDIVFDGELYYNGEVEDNKEGYKKTMENASVKGIKKNLKFIVYDSLTPDEFYKGESTGNTIVRKQRAKKMLKDSSEFFEYLDPWYVGNDTSMIFQLLDYAEKNGEEGVIISLVDAKWENKRAKGCMKLKGFEEADILVVGVYEGEGKYKGKLGGLICQFLYDDKVCNVNIGSGFSDFERSYYMNNRDEIINKVITVKYKEIIKDKEGNVSLRFATWMDKYHIRADKEGLADTNI